MNLFRALRHRNYRLFFSGQIISLVGTWMTTTAMAWLVYRLTHSPLLLGAVGFCNQVPAFFLSPIGGALADHYPRRRILLATQTLSMLQSLLLAALTLSGIITVKLLLVLCVVQGLINAFDMSARQAFVIEIIEDKNDLSNAIALNSSMFNAARLVGPALGALVVASVGEGWCFLIDGCSYAAVILGLSRMRLLAHSKTIKPEFLLNIGTGWRYAFNFYPIRTIIIFLGVACFLGTPFTLLLPVFARNVFAGQAHMLGFLMSLAALGALSGALYLAWRRSILGLGRVMIGGMIFLGVGNIVFGSSTLLWLSAPFLILSGFGLMVLVAASNTILQTIAAPDKRGTVISIFLMSYLGTAPLSNLISGAFAQKFGAPLTLQICGVCCIISAYWFYRCLPLMREVVHPIYKEKGILPIQY